jgi:DNA-binding transcriptional MocR family regulator
MNKYELSFNEDVFKYLQLYRHLKKMIDNGEIEGEEKLLSIREVSTLLKVNTVTVVNAYKKLEQEGYIVTISGSGTYARKKDVFRMYKKDYSDTFKRLPSERLKNMIDFAGETSSSDLFPVGTFKEVLNEVLDRDGSDALIYQEMLGFSGLRESISEHFWEDSISYEDILIISGAQQGIDIISKVMINPGDHVIIEKPTYSGALSVFSSRRAKVHEIEMLKDGVDIEAFEKVVRKIKIKAFYTMSYFQNPTGVTYSLEKKMKILELANKYDFYIIEDDYLSELIYDKSIEYKTFRSLDYNNRVIYIKSFSKIFLPGIRLGYMICPPLLKEAVQNAKVNSDIATSSLMQRALDLYVRKRYWQEHIKFLNGEYNKRYIHLEKAMKEILKDKVSFNSPGGGLNYFVKINNKITVNSTELFYRCREKDVLITPGGMFFKHFEDGDNNFRIGFSQVNEEQITKGINILNEIL